MLFARKPKKNLIYLRPSIKGSERRGHDQVGRWWWLCCKEIILFHLPSICRAIRLRSSLAEQNILGIIMGREASRDIVICGGCGQWGAHNFHHKSYNPFRVCVGSFFHLLCNGYRIHFKQNITDRSVSIIRKSWNSTRSHCRLRYRFSHMMKRQEKVAKKHCKLSLSFNALECK